MKKKTAYIILTLIFLILSSLVPVLAETSVTASVPVTLTVSNEYRAINVTLPASLPVEVINGTVLTANGARIINRSGNVKVMVTDISLTGESYKIGYYDNFSGDKTIALKINGAVSEGDGKLNMKNAFFGPILPGESENITYYAKVSAGKDSINAERVASVIFTISTVD